MKAFVTGGTGFIGQALIKRLMADDWQVVALARSEKKAKKMNLSKVGWCFGDIRERDWHQSVLGADVFIHLVGVHGFLRLSFEERLSIELGGTKSAIAAAKQMGVVHFVHLSTAYTDIGTDYSRAKKTTQQWLEREMRKGFPATVVCPVTVYGPGDLANLHRLFISVAKGRFFFIGSGENIWQLIFIDDLLDGIAKILTKKKKAVGKVFILAGPKPVSLKDFVKTIAQEASVSEPKIHLPQKPMLVMGRAFSFVSKVGLPVPFTADTIRIMAAEQSYCPREAEKILGFKPKTHLATGIKKTAKWYREQSCL